MKTLVIIDFNNLFYRAYYSQKEMHELYPWLPVSKFFDMLRKCSQHIIKKYRPESIEFIFAGESRIKLERTKICSTYKNNRKPINDEVFFSSKKAILNIIRNSGHQLLSVDNFEADDVIASITKMTKDKSIVIFSNDRDMRQLLYFTDTIIYMNPGMFYDGEAFRKEYGISPEYFVIYKALVGDKSDNVEGVSGWGPVKAKKHILSGTWEETIKKEAKEKEFNEAFQLVRLYFLELEICSQPFVIKDLRILKSKLAKLYNQKGVDDILLTIKRFEEIFI